MNGTMPPRDRTHRKVNSWQPSGSAWVVLGVEGLVHLIANYSRRRTPPGCSPAARRGRGARKSGFDRVGPFPVLILGGCDGHSHFLPDGARQEATHGMGLPACSFQQVL